jgi:hypothetical protein
MESEKVYALYSDLRDDVGWSAADEDRVRAGGAVLKLHFDALVDDFYD